MYFERFISNLITLIQTYDKWIDMDSIGFPENWIEVLTSDSKMGLK
ncbi:hypothetical protein AAIM61_003022 [Listeria monocytogenes]